MTTVPTIAGPMPPPGNCGDDRQVLGEEAPADDARAPADHVDDDDASGTSATSSEPIIHAVASPLIDVAACRDRALAGSTARGSSGGGGGRRARSSHDLAERAASSDSRSARATTFTTIVMPNSTTPRPISAERWRSRRLTEFVGDDRRHRVAGLEEVRRDLVLLPMTSATAIVSPIARPSPSITAPTRPLRTRGNTATRSISHRVAPIASAAFLSSCGDGEQRLAAERRDDRRDHDREDQARGHEARAARVPAEEPAEHRDLADRVGDVLGTRAWTGLGEHEQRPEAVHDRRDRGEQVDDVRHEPCGAASTRSR